MRFRTEITPAEWERKIDHGRRGFSVGSCFAETIAGRLKRYKFPLTSNPTGVLFNPASIAQLLWAHPEGLAEADFVLITFGTAWVFEEEGRVVANCEKRPAHIFTRRRLTVSEIVEQFDALFEPGAPLYNRQVVFTLSPVRHLRDGAEENSLSKAVLRLAIDQIIEKQTTTAQYFPAFELLNDDLRDYRFYAADLAHPSIEAVEYVWEKFSQAAITPAAQRLIPEIERLVRATEHRPYNPDSEDHKAFCMQMLEYALELSAKNPTLDFSAEIAFFEH